MTTLALAALLLVLAYYMLRAWWRRQVKRAWLAAALDDFARWTGRRARAGTVLVVTGARAGSAAVTARRGGGDAAAHANAWLGAGRDWRDVADAYNLKGGRVLDAIATPSGRRIVVELPPGHVADKLTSGAVASAVRVEAATVRPGDRPGVAVIDLRDGPDPLAITVLPAPIDDPASLDDVLVGVTEHGDPWRVPIRGRRSHVLVAGVTGSGKGSVVQGIMRGVSPAIRDGLVEAWGLDPKGGMELGMIAPLCARFATTPADMLTVMRDAADFTRNRADTLAGHVRQHVPTPDSPHVLVVIDELANLTAYNPDAAYRAEFARHLNVVLSMGRAVGVAVIAALQDPRKEVIPMRNLFPYRIAFRLDEPRQVAMVLTDTARERGAHADAIPASLPGIGYVVEDGIDPTPVRVRAAYPDDREIRRVALAYAPARAQAPAPAPARADSPEGSQAHDPAPTTRVAAGAPPGEPRVAPPAPPTPKLTRAERSAERRAAWAGRTR